MMLTDTIRAELTKLRDEQSVASDDESADDELAPLRDRIDAIDRALLMLLNERLAYAHEIGQRKNQSGAPVYAPDREADILDNVTQANDGPLPDEVARRLFERIIEETRLLELQHFEATPDEADKNGE